MKVDPLDSNLCIIEPFIGSGSAYTGLTQTGSAAQGGVFPTDTWVQLRIDWHPDLATAEAAAQASRRPMLVVFR